MSKEAALLPLDVNDYDCVINAPNRHRKPGQKRWYEMRGERRDLTNHPNEALELMNAFQQEEIILYDNGEYDNDNNIPKQKGILQTVRPKLVKEKQDGYYILATLDDTIKNVNSKRRKRKSTDEETPLPS